MKVRVFDIMTRDVCSVERAMERIIHMRDNDAFALAFILRKLIWCSYYDPITLELSTDKPFVVPQITYEDIATLSKIMARKPSNRSDKGVEVIAGKIRDLINESVEDDNKEGGKK